MEAVLIGIAASVSTVPLEGFPVWFVDDFSVQSVPSNSATLISVIPPETVEGLISLKGSQRNFTKAVLSSTGLFTFQYSVLLTLDNVASTVKSV